MPKERAETLLTIMEDQYYVTTVLRAFVATGRTQSHPKTPQTPAKSQCLSASPGCLFLGPTPESSAAALAIAKGDYASGVKLRENSVIDKYAEAKKD